MEKVVKSLMEIVNARNALNELLALSGIPNKKTYWLGRNRDVLISILKTWDKKREEVFMKYAIPLTKTLFVPFEKYSEFKKDVFHLFQEPPVENESQAVVEDLLYRSLIGVFSKYEVSFNSGKANSVGVPLERKAEYEEEVEKEIKENWDKIECDIWKIIVDPLLEAVLNQISGEAQLSLAFLLNNENSSIHLVK